jgi:hypothetical protein
MRTFNAFAARIKLILSGYHKTARAHPARRVKAVFLLDLFAADPMLSERWRFADRKARMKDFSPVKVREALDANDAFTSKKHLRFTSYFLNLLVTPT